MLIFKNKKTINNGNVNTSKNDNDNDIKTRMRQVENDISFIKGEIKVLTTTDKFNDENIKEIKDQLLRIENKMDKIRK